MSFPEYLNAIINRHSKHRQVEQIKEQIRKMLPFPSIKHQPKQNIMQGRPKLEQRKTVENFFQTTAKKISLSLQTKSLSCSSTQKNFRPNDSKIETKQNKPSRLPHEFYEQNSNEEEAQSMKEWRQLMMNHIKPKKAVQYKSIQSQSYHTQKNRQRQITSPKIFKIKTAPSHLKKKNRASSKLLFPSKQQFSQKNIILIKPTFVQEEKIQKNLEKTKFQPLKLKKSVTLDKFFNYNLTNINRQSDELTLQKIANFQALLPFLETRKSKVQKKQEKKEITFEVKQSIEQQAKRKKIHKVTQVQMKEQLTGWQTSND